MRVAAFDIGSNTLLMLVAESAGGSLEPLADECRFGRLSQGLDSTGRIADEAIDRSLAVLRSYRRRLDALAPDRVGAVGTQAVREATNAADFLGPAADLIGAPVEVISGEREAALVYRATAEAFPDLAAGTMVIADVGGASTEIIVGRGGRLERAVSVPIGAVRLTERYLPDDPPGADQTKALIAEIDRCLAEVDLPSGAPLVGTAGTATSFASVELRLAEYDADRIQGLRLSPAQVDRQLARFLELSTAEKRELPGLEPQRADVIAAGAAIYARLLNRTGAPEMVVSDRGVRWGLASELAALP